MATMPPMRSAPSELLNLGCSLPGKSNIVRRQGKQLYNLRSEDLILSVASLQVQRCHAGLMEEIKSDVKSTPLVYLPFEITDKFQEGEWGSIDVNPRVCKLLL